VAVNPDSLAHHKTPGEHAMVRTVGVAIVCALVAVAFCVEDGSAAAKTKKNQMVKGTIKSVDTSKSLLIVNQKLKTEFVDRELSILETTQFVIMQGKDKKEAVGADGLQLLEGHEGAPVAVKCDKDVNVLRVTVRLKK
jgi:hypothetical protein